MAKTLVLTFIATDRPGLVERLSEIVAAEGGNWLESRMAHLAEKFAGIATVEIPEKKISALQKALSALEPEGFHITVEQAGQPAATPGKAPAAAPPPSEGALYHLDLVGPDQPGILRDITHCLAERGVSVEDMETDIREAPMSGGLMFYAEAKVRVPAGLTGAELRGALEALAGSLMVDVTLRREG
jgi:glycine cleavage system regulatory protein